jgi:hypothetical protein
MLEPKKRRSGLVVVLLSGVVLGLFLNAYLISRLTTELVATRQLAENYADSFVGHVLLTSYDDVVTIFNKSIAQQLVDDMYFDFQKSAAAVQKLASLTATTALTRAKFFDGTVRVVFYAIASYANMVASIAAKVQSIPPMITAASGQDKIDSKREATAVQGVPDDSFNLLQEVTNVIAELPDWVQHQLNVSDWKILGKTCQQFFNNALSVDWDSTYVAYDWNTGVSRTAEWEAPGFVLRDILFPIQNVCETVGTWNTEVIMEEEKRMHLARTEAEQQNRS